MADQLPLRKLIKFLLQDVNDGRILFGIGEEQNFFLQAEAEVGLELGPIIRNRAVWLQGSSGFHGQDDLVKFLRVIFPENQPHPRS